MTRDRFTRRFFIGTGLAAAGLGSPAIAYDATPIEADNFDSAIGLSQLPEEYMPRKVRLRDDFAPYEVHVDPGQFALFYTLPDGEALRYTVGIGRPGLYESGEFYVGAKKRWPGWTPTPDMIDREPEKYEQYEDGMPGGPGNPLGARALYLFQPQKGDTFLRIHGTNQPSTLARRVSNGCARLVNDHIVHLYARVPMDTRVILYPAS